MIGLRHPLAALAWHMPWQEIEARVAQVFSRKGDVGVAMPDLYLVAEQVQRASVISNAVETCPDVAAWAKNDHWWFHKMVIDRG